MLYINKITNDPQQQMNLTGIPGVTIKMTLRWMPRIQGWIAGFALGSTIIEGVQVVTGANMLRQFKNNIPFGIACLTASGLDPYTINDFATQAANLYLLNAADVAALESGYFQ
jgi:hypothetical protein